MQFKGKTFHGAEGGRTVPKAIFKRSEGQWFLNFGPSNSHPEFHSVGLSAVCPVPRCLTAT